MFARRSLRTRLTLWYALILSAGLGLFGILLWASLRNRLIGEVHQELEGRASRFEQYFRSEAAKTGLAGVSDELEEFCQALPPGSSVQLQGGSGFAFHHPRRRIDAAAGESLGLRREFELGGDQYHLEVQASIASVRHTLDQLRMLLLSLIPPVIVVACMGGSFLSARALKPVRDVTAAALHISIENISDRLPVPATGDEIAQLAEVLNGMLARLEAAVTTLSQFVADASHELRTPLSVIRTTGELALRRSRSNDSYRASLEDITAEAERMTLLVEDLLTLARRDAGMDSMPLEPLDVRDVVREAASGMRTLAAQKNVAIRETLCQQPAIVAANGPALLRLFVLLLDNALKFSNRDREVRVSLTQDTGSVTVSVEDFGVGINAADLPNIFKRFYRTDPARSPGGHGLGLSLAESIARMHGASIEVRSTAGAGSTFRVVFSRPAVKKLNTPVVREGTTFLQ